MPFDPNLNIPEKIDQLGKPLKGVVVNNKDPLGLRRVKVKVEGLLETDNIDNLPWASPSSGQSSGRRANLGSFNVPELYSCVQVTFPNNDIYTPEYSDWNDELVDSKIANLFNEDYPKTKGNIEEDGSWARENIKQRYKEYYHSSGFYYKVDSQGNVVINIPKNLTININGQCNIKVEDILSILTNNNLAINSKGEIGIKGISTVGLESQNELSIQGSHIHLNDGVTYSTASSGESVLNSAVKALTSALSELSSLRDTIVQKGKVAKQAIIDYSNDLLGTRKS